MTEAWKSQAKKFCDICKCWFADNKVSIGFHENGSRHKENVKKKLTELAKKGSAREKEDSAKVSMLARIEKEALKAYKQDLESSAITKTITKSSTTKWVEGTSSEGHQYFWHSESGESVWERPPEGFMTQKDYDLLCSSADEATASSASSATKAKSSSLLPQSVRIDPPKKKVDYIFGQGPEKPMDEEAEEEPKEKKKKPKQHFGKKLKPNSDSKDNQPSSEPKSSARYVAQSDRNAPKIQSSSAAKGSKETDKNAAKTTAPVLAAPAVGSWVAVAPVEPETTTDWGIPRLKQQADSYSKIDLADIDLLPSESSKKIKFQEKTVTTLSLSSSQKPVEFKKRTVVSAHKNLKRRHGDVSDDD